MPGSLIALQVLLMLLPGFAASSIVGSLVTRGKRTDFERVIEGLLYSFFIYSTFILFTRGTLPFRISGAGTATPTVVWNPGQLWILVACTVTFAILLVVYTSCDGNRVLRRIRLTEKTTQHSIWNDIFERVASKDQVVQVELADGKSVIGVLAYYSDEAEDASLFLRQASWVDAEANQTNIPGPGVLLTRSAEIKSVSLLDTPSRS